jgi:hypothetical protein
MPALNNMKNRLSAELSKYTIQPEFRDFALETLSMDGSPSASWTTHPSCFWISYPCIGSPATVSWGSSATGVSEPEWTPSATGRIPTGGGIAGDPWKVLMD